MQITCYYFFKLSNTYTCIWSNIQIFIPWLEHLSLSLDAHFECLIFHASRQTSVAPVVVQSILVATRPNRCGVMMIPMMIMVIVITNVRSRHGVRVTCKSWRWCLGVPPWVDIHVCLEVIKKGKTIDLVIFACFKFFGHPV